MFEKEKMLAFLDAQIGKPYVFGQENKIGDIDAKSWDCSELVESAFFYAGVKVPDGAQNQYNFSTPVTEVVQFDVGFLKEDEKVHHVVIAYDASTIVHAKGTGYGVIKESLDAYQTRNRRTFAGWRRFDGV